MVDIYIGDKMSVGLFEFIMIEVNRYIFFNLEKYKKFKVFRKIKSFWL